MKRRSAITWLLAILALAATPTPIDSVRWWRSPRYVAALRLTSQQRDAIDRVYQQLLSDQGTRQVDADAARTALRHLGETDYSDAELDLAATRTAEAESAVRRVRALALYRMFCVLTPEQRAALSRLTPDPLLR